MGFSQEQSGSRSRCLESLGQQSPRIFSASYGTQPPAAQLIGCSFPGTKCRSQALSWDKDCPPATSVCSCPGWGTMQMVCTYSSCNPLLHPQLVCRSQCKRQGPLQTPEVTSHLSCYAQPGGHCLQAGPRWAPVSGPYLEPLSHLTVGQDQGPRWTCPHPLLVLGKWFVGRMGPPTRESSGHFTVMAEAQMVAGPLDSRVCALDVSSDSTCRPAKRGQRTQP